MLVYFVKYLNVYNYINIFNTTTTVCRLFDGYHMNNEHVYGSNQKFDFEISLKDTKKVE